ncbi:PREDICTED: UDP-glycosyltransferase 74G1-like isoform X2 [Ipomoea nil]|uniref:UDP-glycosyltransferase 74G1-like isoform X2 n=1 Tax=Ipomoea nil TaxID=35883 RepID=UPI000901D20F|nr:PREDICTED: UDP-glycosyltransferase 74G1-like isoform X2 [Ipomoea nil]
MLRPFTEIEMENHENKVVHCLILPYPAQGHINPMLQFSKRLEAKGVKITIAVTKFLLATLQDLSSTHLSIETISDGFDEGVPSHTRSSQAYIDKFRQVGSETLAQVLRRLRVGRFPVSCVVYDAFLPWVLDVAVEEGVSGGCFFTQSCAVDAIYYYTQQGRLKLPLADDEVVEIPGLPCLEPKDMPSFIYSPESYPFVLDLLVDQFCNVEKADWILINTFYELEREVIDWMRKLWVVGAIGPTIPSKYLDNRLPDDKEYGLSVFKPMTEVCMKWLDDRQDGSVVYVSFGSMVGLQEEQMEELAWALRRSNRPFLWVVRSEEANKLPKNFAEEIEEEKRGLVVSWCPQLQVLTHYAVGCFLTHCGWNSTLEAISLGVPMIAMPQWSDQTTNSKLVMDKWKTGVKAKAEENGVVKREEIEECMRRVMEDEEMRANTKKWKQICREAVEEGGTSDRDIQDFVSSLAAKSMTE